MILDSIEITKQNVDVWKLFLTNAVGLLDMYRDLIDTFVLDFFTEDIWSKLSPRCQDAFEGISPLHLANFLSPDAKLRQEKVWPLSVQALRAAAFTYSLPRKPITTDRSFMSYLDKQTHMSSKSSTPSSAESSNLVCSNSGKNDFKSYANHFSSPLQQKEVSWGSATSELSCEAGQHKLLQHVFRRHLKPKKQHEVARLAYIAGQVAHSVSEGVIIDVGSGQGHLSRFLAYGHDVRVVCLEAQDEFIKGAKKFDNQLELAVKKMKRKYESLPPLPPPPRHYTCHLEPNIKPAAFKEIVTHVWPELDSQRGLCSLLGLHTCGDLAPTLLRIFSNLPTCRALVSVACCYMKLSVDKEGSGYPMSDFVHSLKGSNLSYEAREVACHAIEMYTDRLHMGAENLKIHCYRAALEEIIVKDWPEHRHAGLRSVNHAHKMEFPLYAKLAVNKLNNVTLKDEDLHSELTKHNLSRWMQVVVYYSLRLLLAPVIESVVLLDRLLFLYEKDVDAPGIIQSELGILSLFVYEEIALLFDLNIESVLLPAFDPMLSPRNHVLVAIKNENKL